MPSIGARLRYSDNWRQEMSYLLQKDLDFKALNQEVLTQEAKEEIEDTKAENTSEEHLPQIETDELSTNRGFVEVDGQMYGTPAAIATKLNQPIEDVLKYIAKRQQYKENQSELMNGLNAANTVELYLFNVIKHHFTPEAPDGYLSEAGFVEALKSSSPTIAKAIATLGDELGEVRKYKFRSKTVPGYSPQQQQIIVNYLNTKK